jgi:hypothetical protein
MEKLAPPLWIAPYPDLGRFHQKETHQPTTLFARRKKPAPLAVRSSPFWTPKWTPARRNCVQAIERIDEERVRIT